MKKILTTTIIIMGFSSPLLSQSTFERTYGGPYYDGGSCVLQTSDTGYIIVGTSRYYDSEINYIYLVRTDFNGDTLNIKFNKFFTSPLFKKLKLLNVVKNWSVAFVQHFTKK